LSTLSERIVILLHAVGLHWFSKWLHRCCCASRELCRNYLFFSGSTIFRQSASGCRSRNCVDMCVRRHRYKAT